MIVVLIVGGDGTDPAMPARDRSIEQMRVEASVQRAWGASAAGRLATTIDHGHGRCGHLVVWIRRRGR